MEKRLGPKLAPLFHEVVFLNSICQDMELPRVCRVRSASGPNGGQHASEAGQMSISPTVLQEPKSCLTLLMAQGAQPYQIT